MTTSTDGASPSVAPEPEDGSDPCATTSGPDGAEEALDTGSSWLRAEIQRRIAAGRSGTAGRHARRAPVATTSSIGYVPRHSIATPGPGAPRPGPVGGSVSPQPSELLRRERTSRQAWSGPPGPDTAPPEPVAPEAPAENDATDDASPPTGEPAESATDDAVTPEPGAGSDQPDADAPADRLAPDAAAPSPPSSSPDGPPAAVDDAPEAQPPTQRPRPAPAAGGAGSASVASAPDLAPQLPESAGAAPSTESSGSGESAAEATQPTSPPPAPGPTPTRGTGRFARALSLPEPRASAEEITTRIPRVGGPEDLASRRVRVVLAERKRVAHPVRTVVDIQEGTGVGELLRTNLIGSQLAVALRFAFAAGIALGVLPLLFAMVPEIGRFEILGIRLPWLLLGGLVYPFLFGLGLWYARTSERVEQNFADHVQD